jgi:hypothetical protein
VVSDSTCSCIVRHSAELAPGAAALSDFASRSWRPSGLPDEDAVPGG